MPSLRADWDRVCIEEECSKIEQYVEVVGQAFSGGDIEHEVIEFELVHYW